MPLYEYVCGACKHRIELARSVDERDTLTVCDCGETMRRAFGSFRFRVRPRGWRPYDVSSAVGPDMVEEEICTSE